MKYYFRRIICGVAIGLILFYCKSCDVHAYSTAYLYNLSNTSSINMSFDACKKFNDNYMCVNGFEKSLTINTSNSYNTIYRNTNDTLALKSFSMYLTGFSDFQLQRYNNLISTTNFFANLFDYKNSMTEFYPFRYNGFLSYVKLTTTDDTVCEITDNVGATFQNTSNDYPTILPYFETPTECRNKYLKNIELIFQSGYNYSGSDTIFTTKPRTDFNDFTSFLNRNKTNTYLALFDKRNITLTSRVGNIYLYTNSSPYSSTYELQNYTLTSQEIQQNLAELEKQVILASLSGGGSSDTTGPDEPDNADKEKVESAVDDLSDLVGTGISSGGFGDFLSALVQKPIVELTWYANNLGETPGENYCPTLYIPFLVDRTNNATRYGMYLPCMSDDVYSNIPYFYNTSNYGLSISALWYIILHGYLTYLLVLTWLNVIKYTISRNSSEIEVIEL